MSLKDSFGRKINYLRLSITDRCNFRCTYCMPHEGIDKVSHREVLSYEELMILAQAVVPLGIEKIRITGGEPLVRTGILGFLNKLSAISNLKQLVLTTNGALLAPMAADLLEAGVQRLNISLDSLREEKFRQITRCGSLPDVLSGIAAAERVGFPIKINVVAMRGVNDDEIADFAALTVNKPYAVRFIEYMPTHKAESWQSYVIPGEEILQRIAEKYKLQPVIRGEMAGPSRDFKIAGASGTIGVITPLSGHFCQDCNRIRVTSQGQVRNCLFADSEFDLKPFLRAGDLPGLQHELIRVVNEKPNEHTLSEQQAEHEPFAMSNIGG